MGTQQLVWQGLSCTPLQAQPCVAGIATSGVPTEQPCKAQAGGCQAPCPLAPPRPLVTVVAHRGMLAAAQLCKSVLWGSLASCCTKQCPPRAQKGHATSHCFSFSLSRFQKHRWRDSQQLVCFPPMSLHNTTASGIPTTV